MAIHRVADDLVVIDAFYNGTPEAVGVHLLLGERPALIETGPAATVDAVFDGIPRAARLPHVQVYVHPLGAPHLIDPSRLLASAGRLYGDDLPRLFGRMIGIPAERVHVVQDLDEVPLGDRRLVALETPGHARHHHAYWDPERRDLFTGDIAGVALPGSRYVRAPTPPP